MTISFFPMLAQKYPKKAFLVTDLEIFSFVGSNSKSLRVLLSIMAIVFLNLKPKILT